MGFLPTLSIQDRLEDILGESIMAGGFSHLSINFEFVSPVAGLMTDLENFFTQMEITVYRTMGELVGEYDE